MNQTLASAVRRTIAMCVRRRGVVCADFGNRRHRPMGFYLWMNLPWSLVDGEG